jgi:hypothetical protein
LSHEKPWLYDRSLCPGCQVGPLGEPLLTIEETKRQGLELVNRDRAVHGLPPVMSWDELTKGV